MRVFGLPGQLLRIARRDWPDSQPRCLAAPADHRLAPFANGENVSKTCRHFTIARQTFYRWLTRYNPNDLRSLEDRSSRPKHCKQATWTKEEILAVKALRERYPAWGKLKLVVLLARQGLPHLSGPGWDASSRI
ncbi:MAG: helix-turn-helix domain-containing protein [Thermoflexaceae bacterium]|nr:helix-turn-helix domain-containing protein [Thermoflexaceae bacterium]